MQNNTELSKNKRRAAQEKIEDYHRKKLLELLEPIFSAMDKSRTGELDPFEMQYLIHRFHRQAQELFSFVNRYYTRNNMLHLLLEIIEKEEKGEYHWEPKTKLKEANLKGGDENAEN